MCNMGTVHLDRGRDKCTAVMVICTSCARAHAVAGPEEIQWGKGSTCHGLNLNLCCSAAGVEKHTDCHLRGWQICCLRSLLMNLPSD